MSKGRAELVPRELIGRIQLTNYDRFQICQAVEDAVTIFSVEYGWHW